MADYLSIAEVRDRMDRTVDALYADDEGVVQEDWIAADVDAVEGIVNAHLAVRYSVPVSGADAGLLRGLALDLFMAVAHRRKGSAQLPEALQAAADRAWRTLERIATGELSLGNAEPPAERPGVQAGIVVDGNTPRLTRAKLRGF